MNPSPERSISARMSGIVISSGTSSPSRSSGSTRRPSSLPDAASAR